MDEAVCVNLLLNSVLVDLYLYGAVCVLLFLIILIICPTFLSCPCCLEIFDIDYFYHVMEKFL